MIMGDMLDIDCNGTRLEQSNLLEGYGDSPSKRGQMVEVEAVRISQILEYFEVPPA